jgi:hypothetical protein
MATYKNGIILRTKPIKRILTTIFISERYANCIKRFFKIEPAGIEIYYLESVRDFSKAQMIRFAKVFVPNLIPIIGVLFFSWGIFELAFTYFLETGVAFLVFFIDRFFVAKDTRYPFFFALIQLWFLLFPFIGIIWGWIILTFSLTQPDFEENKHMFVALEQHVIEFNFYWVLVGFFVFEVINYFMKNKGGRNDKTSSVWFNLKKFLMVHLFVILCTFIYSILPHNTLTGLIFIMSLKIVLDYVLENDKTMHKLDRILSKFATFGLNDDGTAIKDEDD